MGTNAPDAIAWQLPQGVVDLTATEDYVNLSPANPVQPLAIRNYLAVGSDTAFNAADFLSGVNGSTAALEIEGIPDGETRHVAYARQASRGAPVELFIYQDGHRNEINQLGTWPQQPGGVTINGEDYVVLVSRGSFGDHANGFLVEIN